MALLLSSVPYIFSSFRFNKTKIEHLLHFTEIFTWEEMPTRDAETGHITLAGIIKRTQPTMKYVSILMLAFHAIQSSVHMWKNHDMVFTTWYPFEVSNSPVYEVINITQVMFHCSTFPQG
jgi:hypothetical protein